jgi:hypothetical protein
MTNSSIQSVLAFLIMEASGRLVSCDNVAAQGM